MLEKFASQFGKPKGVLGRIAGKLMAATGVEKNRWTISLLNIERDDHVLEIGFGPGVAIELASRAVQDGSVVGIDYSNVMLKQAHGRNKEAILEGRVKLMLADAGWLPSFDVRFDKVFSVNSIIFWKEPVETLKKVRRLMKPNAVIALTVQPYTKGATEQTVRQFGDEVAHYVKEAGFSDIKIELKAMKPAGAVCVLGNNNVQHE